MTAVNALIPEKFRPLFRPGLYMPRHLRLNDVQKLCTVHVSVVAYWVLLYDSAVATEVIFACSCLKLAVPVAKCRDMAGDVFLKLVTVSVIVAGNHCCMGDNVEC